MYFEVFGYQELNNPDTILCCLSVYPCHFHQNLLNLRRLRLFLYWNLALPENGVSLLSIIGSQLGALLAGSILSNIISMGQAGTVGHSVQG